jgi:RimJ/RimL family protein N-acetyltransferase
MRFNGFDSDEYRRWWDSVDLGFAHYLDDELVGHTSFLNDRPEDRVVEIGNTWLHPRAWGTDANTEAKYLLMRHAFEDEGYLRVEFKTDANNERSRPALEKVGATFEGVARKHQLVRGGERRDSAWYAVIDDDWPEVKALIERRLVGQPRTRVFRIRSSFGKCFLKKASPCCVICAWSLLGPSPYR